MLNALRLIPALQVIFRTEIEFTVDSFVELNAAQRDVFQQKMGDSTERIYRVVLLEPTVVERQEGNVTLEISIVTESERQLLLDAVDFVHRASAKMPNKPATFQQRLAYLRPRLPPIVTRD